MRTWIGLSLTALAALGVAGCGGGSGSKTFAPATPATQTRALQVGDQWVYAITGHGQNAAGQAITAAGTWTFTIANKPFNGGTALAKTVSIRLTTSDGQTNNVDGTIFISQDATTHDIFELGVDNGLGNPVEVAATPVKIVFGSWANGAKLNTKTTFTDNGVDYGDTLTVVGSEAVITKIGSFKAWKVTDTNGGTVTQTQDWAPQLGAPVQYTNLPIFFGSSAGNTAALLGTAVLQSTTVPH